MSSPGLGLYDMETQARPVEARYGVVLCGVAGEASIGMSWIDSVWHGRNGEFRLDGVRHGCDWLVWSVEDWSCMGSPGVARRGRHGRVFFKH